MNTQRPPLGIDVDRYAVGVPATGEPVAGVTGGGGGGVIGAQELAGGGPAGIWIVLRGRRIEAKYDALPIVGAHRGQRDVEPAVRTEPQIDREEHAARHFLQARRVPPGAPPGR